MKRNPVMMSEQGHKKVKESSIEAGMSIGLFIEHLNRIMKERSEFTYSKWIENGDMAFLKKVGRISGFLIMGATHLVDIEILTSETMYKLLGSDSGRDLIGIILDADSVEAKQKIAEKYDVENNIFI